MFKKLIVSIVILAISTGVAARDITVTFTDGSQHEYNNTPSNVTPSQVKDRVERDFPNKRLNRIEGTAYAYEKEPVEESSGWSTLGYILLGVVVVGAIVYGAPLIMAASGGCQHSYQTAKDGSRCGARSADSRPGGR